MNNDLISRSALIKALNEAQIEFDEYYKGLGKAKVITDNAPTVERPQGEWIPVSEKLPKENVCDDGYHEPSKWVLVQTSNGQMLTTRYWSRDIKNVWTDLCYLEDVIAWMSLPEPYKEGGEEE